MVGFEGLRSAAASDIALLVRHRRAMFLEMVSREDRPYDKAKIPILDETYAAFLGRTLGTTSFGWVFEAHGRALSSGALSIVRDMPPSLRSLEGPTAYLYGVYTEPDARRRGLARLIVEAAVACAKEQGAPEVTLFASVAGRPLYEVLGFKGVPNFMRRV